jgi:transposase
MIYSEEQLQQLRANPNVKRCSSKSITYAPAFKQRAVKQYYEEGLSPRQIFLNAGFDLQVLGKHKPKDCLKLWKGIYKAKGMEALASDIDQRGKNRLGKKKPKYDENDPDYLKAKIAYLEAENDFLRKLKTKPKL